MKLRNIHHKQIRVTGQIIKPGESFNAEGSLAVDLVNRGLAEKLEQSQEVIEQKPKVVKKKND